MIRLLKIDLGSNRIFGLDILRALAILFVVIGHGQYLLPISFKSFHNLIVFDGVSIFFFVLSGFLIGGILIKLLDHNQPSFGLLADFWVRRWFRTLPNYFLILIILLGFSYIYSTGDTFWIAKRYFIFSQNLFSEHPYFFPEAWSLSIEEWFYLITPVLMMVLIALFRLSAKRAILLTVFTVIILILIWRYYKYSTLHISDNGEWDRLFRKQVFTRLDSLMFGVLGAYLQYYFREFWNRIQKPALIVGVLIFISLKILYVNNWIEITGLFHCVLSFSVTSLATLLLLPYLSNLKSGTGIAFKFFTSISLISYSMYLINLTLIQTFILDKINWEIMGDQSFLIYVIKYILYWFLTISFSILIYKYYEIPMTRLRDSKKIKGVINKFFSRKSPVQ